LEIINYRQQTDHPGFIPDLPIGSGAAPRKTSVQQHLCASDMRRKTRGAGIALSLRANDPHHWTLNTVLTEKRSA
jgi:hypothetical protein